MRISFDLDNTLIPGNPSIFPTEERNIIQKILGIERLREGTRELFLKLRESGNEIGIYTTSYRTRLKIKTQFKSYRIKTDFIINEKRNRKELKKIGIFGSKYPPAFGIDLHIDDSKGVGIEGEKLGFKTIIIDIDEKKWKEKIEKNALQHHL